MGYTEHRQMDAGGRKKKEEAGGDGTRDGKDVGGPVEKWEKDSDGMTPSGEEDGEEDGEEHDGGDGEGQTGQTGPEEG